MGCCIQLETPHSIKAKDGTDVFTKALLDTGLSNNMTLGCYTALWARHEYKALGNTDREYWISCCRNRVREVMKSYIEKFEVYEEYKKSDYKDLSDGASEVTYEHEDTPDSDIEGKKYLSSRDTTRVKSFSGLPATTLRDDLEAVQDPYRDFAREFDDLFCGRL